MALPLISRQNQGFTDRFLVKSLVVTFVTVGFFFSGQPIALVALVAAGVLLLEPGSSPRRFTNPSTGHCW